MSRDLKDLTPYMEMKASVFQTACLSEGVDILIYCTRRTASEQSIIYRKGRPLSVIQHRADELSEEYGRPDLAKILLGVGPQDGNRILTHAGPGQSMHNYGEAFDFVPLLGGKAVWDGDDRLWDICGEIAKNIDLIWGGSWPKRKRDMPHVQRGGLRWQSMIQKTRFA